MNRRPIEFDFDRNLRPGEAFAVADDGIKMQKFLVPDQRPPDWAVKVILSIEDYGRLIQYSAREGK